MSFSWWSRNALRARARLQNSAIGLVLTGVTFLFAQPLVIAGPIHSPGVHGVWVWDTAEVIGSDAALTTFISALKEANATEAYVYLRAKDYIAMEPALTRALAEFSHAGLHAWGLEGSREYFSDVDGPGQLYAAADALVAFNSRHATGERFSGFVSDMEPQDGQAPAYPLHFHNDIPDSGLTSRQAADRQELMADWLQIHQRLGGKMRAAELQYAAAMPAWTDNYYGEPVHVLVNDRRQEIQLSLMGAVNSYIVMCYNTSPENVITRLRGKVDYAAKFGAQAPLIFAVLETHAGAGRGVSYGDDASKNTRSAVLADIRVIRRALSGPASFGGVDVHDWIGWSRLRP